ncbi:hypothetical protein ACR4XJ_11105 [Nitratidesulfovibrio sp. D1]|uniref:hypothetical protein n=1 Tax=Nitratidesulfovibrio sp. D1 TaxID=3440151 RepID=UPI003EBA419D
MSHVMSVRFDGDILSEQHYISLRTASKVFGHLQVAVDRAHLQKLGRLHKHAKLGAEQYQSHVIWLGDSLANCRTFQILADNDDKQLIDVVKMNFVDAFEGAVKKGIAAEVEDIRDESRLVLAKVESGVVRPTRYNEFRVLNEERFSSGFIRRAIAKELVKIGSVVSSEGAGASSITLDFLGEDSEAVTLNRQIAELLRNYVGQRSLGDPVVYAGEYRGGDVFTKTGKFKNALNGKTMIVRFDKKEDAMFLNGFSGQVVSIVCCPVLEYGTHDVECGDVFYLKKI